MFLVAMCVCQRQIFLLNLRKNLRNLCFTSTVKKDFSLTKFRPTKTGRSICSVKNVFNKFYQNFRRESLSFLFS